MEWICSRTNRNSAGWTNTVNVGRSRPLHIAIIVLTPMVPSPASLHFSFHPLLFWAAVILVKCWKKISLSLFVQFSRRNILMVRKAITGIFMWWHVLAGQHVYHIWVWKHVHFILVIYSQCQSWWICQIKPCFFHNNCWRHWAVKQIEGYILGHATDAFSQQRLKKTVDFSLFGRVYVLKTERLFLFGGVVNDYFTKCFEMGHHEHFWHGKTAKLTI